MNDEILLGILYVNIAWNVLALEFPCKGFTFQDGIVLSLVECRLTLSEIKNNETSFGDRCLMYAIMCTKFDISCAFA